MPSWNLDLSGTARTSNDPPSLGVLTVFVVRWQSVSRDIGSRWRIYGYTIEVARTSVVLSLAFLQLPEARCVFIEQVLACFGVDRPYQSSFAMRISRAADGLFNLYPDGFHLTAILDLMTAESSEVEDLVMRDLMAQLDSESSWVMRGASESAILGLKEKVYAAEDGECCSICLEDFHRAEKVAELPCSHVFHRPCIIQWLDSSNSCPLCRCQLDT
ncbi:E3 ubiquitin-protein ligase RNF181-like [Rhodamnia argentea]|uniref:E3 ubiquitin-protein ligase RNF181-like n=1 Tax=Rhodamnia argentea TaxID=178133 RepID=A0A8B8QU97_9MYRT|nr:E3 ubiquitin-protein ligase RNF181-like [Rhodamnia argentea]